MKTPQRYENAKWEDVPKEIQEAVYAMPKTKKGIYIHGEIGSGKSHIAWAIKKQVTGPRVVFWNVPDLMQEIRNDMDRTAYDKMRPEEKLTENSTRFLLILDDIGAEKATEFVAEKLYRIINHRYNEMIPTVFTSNLTLGELAEQIGERCASRIAEMCEIINLTGGDRRLK